MCHRCKASNLLVRANGTWTAWTTDSDGIFDQAAFQRVNFSGTRVAVIGCGGSGRVAAAALVQAGAEVTIVNRGSDRGKWAGNLLGLRFVPLKDFSLRGYSAMINATPVGRDGEELPVDLKNLDPGSLVVDLVYRREGLTPLVAACPGSRPRSNRRSQSLAGSNNATISSDDRASKCRKGLSAVCSEFRRTGTARGDLFIQIGPMHVQRLSNVKRPTGRLF